MNKLLFVVIVLLTGVNRLNAQMLDSISETKIVHNILSFHYRFSLSYDLQLDGNDLLQSDEKLFFMDLWPTIGNKLKIRIEKSSISYPIKDYLIYSVYKKGFQMGNDSISSYRLLTSLLADEYYLIAHNMVSGKLKFLSGNFFKSTIASDFELDIKKPETFYDFLKIKFYNFNVNDIKFNFNKRDKMYFTAYSQLSKINIILIVDKRNFDAVSIKIPH